MTLNLSSLIEAQWPSLTTNQQKIADFVLANPFQVATMGIEELATATETSAATITRFVKALSLSGFADFRAHAVQGYQGLLKTGFNLERARQTPPSCVAQDSFENATRLVEEMALQGDSAIWESTALRMMSARRVAFLGFGISANILELFADKTISFTRNQILLTGSGGSERIVQKIIGLGPEDLLIAMSLPRYSQSTVDFMKLARGRGCYCISISDGPQSPIYALSHEQIVIPSGHPVLHGSTVAAMAAIEAIIAILAAHHQSESDAISMTSLLMPYLYADDENHPQSRTRTTDVS
ncbi:MurR/RpiR family transcriptional regulator [Pseudochrobactrum sp. MP213Fo]|uniref:MurR/RpiR family transcriptional regulator n=1 Tax=Pseudochrobactrum sp. MP213Fo TaxID=3022250 RepID=UPI003BA1C0BA